MSANSVESVLLTGATGFLGGHLLDALLERGYRVRATSRRPPHLVDLPDHPRLEVVKADVLRRSDLKTLFRGIDAAFYMVHSMEGGVGEAEEFVEKDRRAARNFAEYAERDGVGQIVYVSGLKPEEAISKHLESRNEVERVLGESNVPLTVLRAGFIIGPGSAGYQMLTSLLERLDVMISIPEYEHETNPAYVDDVVEALICCIEHRDQTGGEVFEIGSREDITYRGIIELFAEYMERDVEWVDVPWAPRAFGSAFVSSMSNLPYGLVRALSDGLSVSLFVTDERLYDICEIPRTSPREAVRRSLQEF
jgi:uncharacterized protein YbjT (DUF2867 family)